MNISWRRIVSALLLSWVYLPGYAGAQEVSVVVKPHRQEHSLSCETATLKMALSAHGVDVAEKELIARLPFDATPKQPGIWGDPQAGFVGAIDGRMLMDGYGVHWQPIADVGRHYARTTVLTHGSAQQLASAISQGNPVIIWGYYGTQRAVVSWQTLQGLPVQAVYGEHTRLVYGFDGPVSAPTRFYLIDPASGAFSWSTAELMHNWSSLQHMGVIVAKQPTWVRVPGEARIWEIDSSRKSRRWVRSWQAFVDRGGIGSAVTSIAPEKLAQYTVGADIK